MNQARLNYHISKKNTNLELIGGYDCDPDVEHQVVDLDVAGGARIRKRTCLGGDVIARSDVTVEGNMVVMRDICGDTITANCFAGNAKALYVDDCITVLGDLDINGNLLVDSFQVTGNLEVDTLKIAGDEMVMGDLNVTGNLLVESFEVMGNLVIDTLQITGNLSGDVTGDVLGDVRGNVLGGVSGGVVGDVTGNVLGGVSGGVTGDVTGDVQGNVLGGVSGGVVGDVTGNVLGGVSGGVVGDVTGDVLGNVLGGVTGGVTGDVTGDVLGNVIGCVTGDVLGNVLGGVTGDVTGDVLGNVLGGVSGGVTGDVTGDVLGNVLGGVTGNISADQITAGNIVVSGGTIDVSPVSLAPSLLDAFGRQKVSNPFTLLDTKFLTDENPETWDTLISGNATSTFNPGYMDLVVMDSGDRVVRQTRAYSPYQPGKGLVALITGTLETSGNVDLTSKIGLFDDHDDKSGSLDTEGGGNGYFFQSVDGAISVVQRSYITGVQVDTVIPQASWNVDTFDGSGPSGIVFDPTKRQIFVIEMEWLGVGTAVMGLFIERQLHFAHIFYHANVTDTKPYITRPTLPVRYELESTGGIGEMIQICATVLSDGGYTPLGSVYSASTGTSSVTVTTTETPVLSLRLKTSRKRTILSVVNTSLQSDTANNVLFRVYRFLGPVSALTGASWTSVDSRSAAEFDISATAVTTTGGIRLADQFVNNQTNAQLLDLSNKFGIIAASDIIGNTDQIIITAQAFSGSPKVMASLQWQELE